VGRGRGPAEVGWAVWQTFAQGAGLSGIVFHRQQPQPVELQVGWTELHDLCNDGLLVGGLAARHGVPSSETVRLHPIPVKCSRAPPNQNAFLDGCEVRAAL
jgi:hypothetical protein